MSTQTASGVDFSARPARRRSASYAWPIGLAVLAIGATVAVRSSEILDPAWTNVTTLIACGLGAILIFAWIGLFAPWQFRTRMRIVGGAIGLVAAVLIVSKPKGFHGDLSLTGWEWRFGKHGDALLPSLDDGHAPRMANLAPGGERRIGKNADAASPAVNDPRSPDAVSQSSDAPAVKHIDIAETSADDSPQFLGPDRNGITHGPKLARDWQAHPPRQRWKRELGSGWSSFAVANGYAVTQEQRGDSELIVCYDMATGDVMWSHAEHVRFSEKLGGDGPRATPTIYQGRVYALGATGLLNCLDGATGQQVWMHDIITENSAPLPMYGTAGSPLIVDDRVVVCAGGPDNKSLVAYDCRNGRLAWAAGKAEISYSSPMLATLAGVRQILIVDQIMIVAHDPDDGHVLWTYPWPGAGAGSQTVSQPFPLDDGTVFFSKGYGVGSMLLRVAHHAGDWDLHEAWHSSEMKTKFSSAIIRDGLAYGLDETILECVDVATGKRVWKQGRYGYGQVLWIDDLLLLLNEAGDVVLLEPSKSGPHELTRFTALEGNTWNVPVLSGHTLLVRNAEWAACYELPVDDTP